jgi:hypothetical protein
VLIAGLTNALPYPVALGSVGMPGCWLSTDIVATAPVLLGATGAGAYPFAVPSTITPGVRFYTQYAVLDLPANTFGFTTSNYVRVLAGL